MPNRRMTLDDVSAIQDMLDAGMLYADIAESTGFQESTIGSMHRVLNKHGKKYRKVSAIRSGGLAIQKRNREARSRPDKVAMEKVEL